MVELKKYFDRLEPKIGETYSADKILEGPWWEVVVKELNQMSCYCARALHALGRALSLKSGQYDYAPQGVMEQEFSDAMILKFNR